ncbi:MAG: cytidylate kinase-like family protein [Verrucomicrobiota bacterium]
MSTMSGFDHCFTFINCQLQPPGPAHLKEGVGVRAVTISRQSGCGGCFFAEELAVCLQALLPHGARRWTVFDRDLVDAVLRDHHLPARLASFMPEDRVTYLHDIIEDLFSLHPPTETLVRRASETILHLAQLGNAIIVGRAANVITARLPGMLHLRLIGSVEHRLAHMREFDHLDKKAALRRIRREDGGRRRYLKSYFGSDIDDPLLYHLVINTSLVPLPDAVKMVGSFALLHHLAPPAAMTAPAPSKTVEARL